MALLIVRAIPRATIIVPRVAMNGGSLSLVINNPFNKPFAIPTNKPITILSHKGTPAMAAMTETVPESAMIDPMDKSMPPVMIANVTPIPMIVTALVCKARLSTLRIVKKFGAVSEKNINKRMTTPKVINFSTDPPDLFNPSPVVLDASSILLVVDSLMSALS